MSNPRTTCTNNRVSRPQRAQITTAGVNVEAEKGPITILDALHSWPENSGVIAGAGHPRDDRDEFHKVKEIQPYRICAAYLHLPFCFHKCHYCDFYSIVDSRERQAAFVERMAGELRAVAEYIREPVQTIFVGGGTPTLLAPALWRTLLAAIHECVPLIDGG